MSFFFVPYFKETLCHLVHVNMLLYELVWIHTCSKGTDCESVSRDK